VQQGFVCGNDLYRRGYLSLGRSACVGGSEDVRGNIVDKYRRKSIKYVFRRNIFPEINVKIPVSDTENSVT